MTEDQTGAVIGAVLLALGAWAVVAATAAAADGRLGPNWVAGLRTRTIMTDAETWRAGHRAGLAGLRQAAWATTLLGAVAVWGSFVPGASGAAFAMLLAGAAALLAGVVQAAVRGQRAATEVLTERRRSGAREA